MSDYEDRKKIINDLDWNQFSLEQLKKIQSQVSKAITHKKFLLDLTTNASGKVSYYKASVSKVFPSYLRNSLADYQSCILLVSLGSKNFIESKRLQATIEWISKNFQSCTVIIGDSLYRLTLEVRHQTTRETALHEALQAGQEFINQTQSYFDPYAQKCNFECKRTSELQKISQFSVYYQHLQKLYQKDPHFQDMVTRFVHAYLHRGKTIDIEPSNQPAIREAPLVTTYFLEESAILACLVEEENSVFIYPGAIKTFEEISEGLHPEVPEPLQRMIWVSLRLKKKCYSSAKDS